MVTMPDIAGANATVQIALVTSANGIPYGTLAGAPSPARWVQFVVTGSGTVRIGDSLTSASRGIPLTAGQGLCTSPYSSGSLAYQSGEFYAYIPSGTTLSVAYKEW